MRAQISAVLIGLSLVLASHLGMPSKAGAEDGLACFSDGTAGICQPELPAGLLASESFAACVDGSGLPGPLPVKRVEDADSSALVMARELGGPMSPRMRETATLMEAAPSAPVASASYEVEDNHAVRRFLDQFQTGYRRAVVERWLVRAGRYLPMLLDVFKQKGLPEELVFTAMIESGFDPLAASRAGARGLWQFMAPTARRYGLRVDRWLDERLDPEKSTVAAARHFLDLYAVFGSWNLAQAAYNAGERTVLEAIRAMGTSDFWALARGRQLKDETKNFIPAIQAATLIAREPERYGFVVTPASPLTYEVVSVPRATSLKHLASKSGVDLETLERLNPELRLKQTPPDGTYPLKVPVGTAGTILAVFARPVVRPAAAGLHVGGGSGAGRGSHVPTPGIHVVKPRETVLLIAKRYGVSVADIVRWNDLDDTARIFPGDRLRVTSAGRIEEAQGGFR
jgi:membrane-bound lytic murein transglycosylase D